MHRYLREEIGDIKADHSILWLYPDLVDSVHKQHGILNHVHGVASQGGENLGQLLGKLVEQGPNGRHNWPHGGVILIYIGRTFVGQRSFGVGGGGVEGGGLERVHSKDTMHGKTMAQDYYEMLFYKSCRDEKCLQNKYLPM